MSERRPRRTRREVPAADVPMEEHCASAHEAEGATAISANDATRLTCTLAAMCSLFALFLCYAEKRSRIIRSYAVQSTALAVVHLGVIAALVVVSTVLGGIPFLGFLIKLCCCLAYLSVLIVLAIVRVRMMLAAWQGARYKLPIVGAVTERYI